MRDWRERLARALDVEGTSLKFIHLNKSIDDSVRGRELFGFFDDIRFLNVKRFTIKDICHSFDIDDVGVEHGLQCLIAIHLQLMKEIELNDSLAEYLFSEDPMPRYYALLRLILDIPLDSEESNNFHVLFRGNCFLWSHRNFDVPLSFFFSKKKGRGYIFAMVLVLLMKDIHDLILQSIQPEDVKERIACFQSHVSPISYLVELFGFSEIEVCV